MSEYREGIWYGWTGGDRPVHQKAIVKVILRDSPTDPSAALEADDLLWDNSGHNDDIIAFCVVDHYVEPREYWVNEYPDGLGVLCESFEEARSHARSSVIRTIHLREVMDE